MKFKALLIAAILLAAGCVTTPDTPDSGLLAADSERDSATARNCLQYTGSRIKADGSRCIGAPGRVYTFEDIYRTGATTLGGVLLRLDPSL